MEPLDIGPGIGAALLLVLANGFFVAAEFSIVKVRDTQLQPLAQRSARARLALHIIRHLDAYLAACQVGITLSSLALGWIGEPAIAGLLEPALVVAIGSFAPAVAHGIAIFMAFTFISGMHIVLGELAPKSVAIQRSLPTALLVAYPLHWFYRLMFPFIAALNAIGNWVVRLIGLRPATEAERAHSPEELGLMLEAAGSAGLIEADERDVARRALAFGDRTVRSVMVPRTDLVSVPGTATLPELLAMSAAHPFTRLPVHAGETEDITGVVHVRDLAHAQDPTVTAAHLQHPVAIIPETADLLQAVALLRRESARVGVVVDEYGGTAGIVTLGTIAEQLIGPVGDEYAPEHSHFREAPDGSLLIDGHAPLAAVRERLSAELPGGAAETIAGFVIETLGRIASVGDAITVEGVRLEVSRADGHRIEQVRATRDQVSEAEPVEARRG